MENISETALPSDREIRRDAPAPPRHDCPAPLEGLPSLPARAAVVDLAILGKSGFGVAVVVAGRLRRILPMSDRDEAETWVSVARQAWRHWDDIGNAGAAADDTDPALAVLSSSSEEAGQIAAKLLESIDVPLDVEVSLLEQASRLYAVPGGRIPKGDLVCEVILEGVFHPLYAAIDAGS